MQPSEERLYSIADIEALPKDQRAELIDGKIYMMAPPTINHQNILVWLSNEIFNCVKSHKADCKVLPAPFGIAVKKDDKNYAEPDISVICVRNNADQKDAPTVPDWIIEISSPSSSCTDYQLKPSLYKETGVREYWVVDYDRDLISVYCLQKSPIPDIYHFTDTVKVRIYEDWEIDFSKCRV